MGWLGIFGALTSCTNDTEFDAGNRAPVVRIATESINLPDSVQLNTRIQMFWSGEDADGYVKGYRISWSTDKAQALTQLATAPLVSVTDSSFLFSFSGSSDTASIHFYVASVDEKGLQSQSPAYLKIPVRNSPPFARFLDDGMPLADTIWSVLSMPYQVGDPDGFDNLAQVALKVNDGDWVSVPKNLSFLSLVPTDPSAFGNTTAILYAGENLSTLNAEPRPLSGITLTGLKMNDINRIYIRATDQAGAVGLDTTLKAYFFKRKTSDLLLVDAYKGEGAFIGDTLYTNLIRQVKNYDRIDMNVQAGINQPLFWNSTFYLLCKQYKMVFWYSDILTNLPGQNPLMLTSAASPLIQYLRFDGKLLCSVTFPDAPNQMSMDDPVFALAPIDSISRLSGIARLRRNVPVLANKPGYVDLQSTNNLITGIDVFYTKPGVDTAFIMPKTSLTNTYTGPDLPIALRTRNPLNGRTNMVFFAMELLYLSGDRQALRTNFEKIFNDEFNW